MAFLFSKPKPLFDPEQIRLITEAVRTAEQQTSGEIRVFVESHCKFMDPVDRATEIFGNLKMDATRDRNAVLLYLALRDRQLAVIGDQGIHERVGTAFWLQEVQLMIARFNAEDYALGITGCIEHIGESLRHHFPYDQATDKNELPDDIVFGK